MLESENQKLQEQTKEGIASEKDALQNNAGVEGIDENQAKQSNVEADQQINDVRERFGK